MDPSQMADSDLYQHLLNVECEHNISPQKNAYLFGSYTLNMSPSNLSISSLYSSTTSNTSSTTSISSLSNLSNLSDDDLAHRPSLPESYHIDGGLQRALVIMVSQPRSMHTTGLKSKLTDYSAAYDDRLTINEEPEPTNTTTFSFDSWMQSYKNQPHRILSHNRSRRRVVRRNKRKTHQNLPNKAQLTHLDTLRNDLPWNPHKLRKLMRHTRCRSHCTHLHHTMDSIETIQREIIALQNQLEDIRRMERIRRQIRNWKEFKLHCGNWRLIDLYEYLSRIKGRKYAQYFANFEVFYTQWMDIYDADQKSSNQRFVSHIFDGKVLSHLDHNDLMIFGVYSKADRREILMQIQIINKT
eukprot:152386_1